MKRKWLVKALCMSTCLLLASGFAACRSQQSNNGGGNGGNKPEEFLPISTVEELMAIGNTGSSYVLTRDLDLSGISWEPIKEFSGKLDGNEKKITNLTISQSNGTLGMFEVLKGKVYDLTLENASVSAMGMSGDMGALCGRAENATIENVTVYGEVSAKLVDHVGGIAGVAVHTLITNCKNYASVEGFSRVGGIAGSYERQIASDDKYIEGSENYGDVSGYQTADDGFVGGIFGETYLRPGGYRDNATNWNFTLQGFKNYGTVTSAGGYVGGIVGVNVSQRWPYGDTYVDLSIVSSTNEGIVTGTNCVGGIVGRFHFGNTLMNVENKGAVTGTGFVGGIVGSSHATSTAYNKNSGSVTGAYYVAGIAAYSSSVVKDCENSGAITATGLTSTTEGVAWSNGAFAGGIVGATSDYVTNSKNSGEIISTGGGNYVGGVAGFMNPDRDVIIDKLENSGNITVTGGTCIGGIAGYMHATRPKVNNARYTFTGNNSGEVSAPTSTYVGGIIGYVNCQSDWSYQDRCYIVIINTVNTGNVTGYERVAGIVGTANKYLIEDEIYWETNNNEGYITATEGTTVHRYHIDY